MPRRGAGARPADNQQGGLFYVEYTARRAASARRRAHRLLAGAGLRAGDVRRGCTALKRTEWHHGHRGAELIPGNLLLSTSDYVPGGHHRRASPQLPPGAGPRRAAPCATAIADGDTTRRFNNDRVDAFFGVTSPMYLDELTPWGQHVGPDPGPDQRLRDELLVEVRAGAEPLEPRGQVRVVHGLLTPSRAAVDVSNANTPGVIDPANPVDVGTDYRVGRGSRSSIGGHFTFTLTNAYSGDNGRAAITNDEHGQT